MVENGKRCKKNNKTKKVVSLIAVATVGATLVGCANLLGASSYADSEDSYLDLRKNTAFQVFQDEPERFSYKSLQEDINTDLVIEPEEKEEENNQPQEVKIPSDKMHFLVLGVDSRADKLVGRTDAMIVVALDNKENKLDMVSIPRDTYTELVGRGRYDKITHAFAFGGLDMAKSSVENLLDIDIDNYAVLNFTSFLGVVDAIGGIEIDVPYAFSEQDSRGTMNAIRFEKGLQTLDGEEALAYARMRMSDPKGDIGRGERQQQIIEAVINKLASISSIPKYTEVYRTVMNSVDTNVGIMDIATFAPYIRHYDEINTHTIDGAGVRKNGVYYYQLNNESLQKVKQTIQ